MAGVSSFPRKGKNASFDCISPVFIEEDGSMILVIFLTQFINRESNQYGTL
jgi:hypothetical protein